METYLQIQNEFNNLNIKYNIDDIWIIFSIEELIDIDYNLKQLKNKINKINIKDEIKRMILTLQEKSLVLNQPLSVEEEEFINNLSTKGDTGNLPYFTQEFNDPFNNLQNINIDFNNENFIDAVQPFLNKNNIYNQTKDYIKNAILNRKTVPFVQININKERDINNFKNNNKIIQIYIQNLLNKNIKNFVNKIVFSKHYEDYFENNYHFYNQFFEYKYPNNLHNKFISSIDTQKNKEQLDLIKLYLNLESEIENKIFNVSDRISSFLNGVEVKLNNSITNIIHYENVKNNIEKIIEKIVNNPKFDWNYKYNNILLENLINEKRGENLSRIKELNKKGLIGPINEHIYSFIKRFGKKKSVKKSKSRKSLKKSIKSKSKKSLKKSKK